MSLISHAKFEMRKMLDSEEDINREMGNNVLELIQTFADQGHSGMSAGFCVSLFKTLANFEPLGPITGEDDEWNEVSEGCFQNRRCSHVFKQDGRAYDINGKVFREPNGCCFTNGDSRVPVTFPYIPKTEYIDVP